MQYVTLEQVDQYLAQKTHQKKHFFIWKSMKEVFQFCAIFGTVFLFSTILINANLFYHTMKNVFLPVRADDVVSSMTAINTSLSEEETQALQDQSQFLEQQVAASFESSSVLPDHTETMSYYLSAKVQTYSFQYNTLPPENKLIIPAIGLNAPIVDVSATTELKIRKGDFDQELYSGVVKYPSTPEPGMTGNALIFGHTSYYRWKKNPYGEVFAKIYALKEGDLIQTLWHGQLTEFEVVKKIIVNPEQVDDTYMEYTDGQYITLMGCYPIGSDQRRVLIIAKKKVKAAVPNAPLSNPQK